MSSKTTFTFTFSDKDDVCSSGLLMIEQKEWEDVGVVTRDHIAAYLMKLFYDYGDYPVDCGFRTNDAGLSCYRTEVYAFPYVDGVPFDFHLSHGIILDSSISEERIQEIISLDIDKDISTDYPVQEILSTEWVGPVYDEDGNILPRPPVAIINNRTLSLPYMVYGALKIEYKTKRHMYEIEVQVREDAVENAFQSFAYCTSECGIEYIELEPLKFPSESACARNGGITSVIDPDDDTPTSPKSDKLEKFDYCTREPLE